MSDFWKDKLLAFLHDSPSKALDIRKHSERAEASMRRAGFSDEEVRNYIHEADWAAAAADRIPFPHWQASGMTCARALAAAAPAGERYWTIVVADGATAFPVPRTS